MHMIFILNFQFPEETENTQSPSANKNGNYIYEFKLIDSSRDKQLSECK